ncbi:LysR family transcriptional regulator [Rhizocola hellebori]|uniref:LysR family transcriptional regulator n=1 Tax=Rhizocola hellebori TaxID=1392758 RepID=A0A8J3QI44_9ACTN|nr:LysR family transcriptional regulator [Rhizocola hellebori]GIH11298.1 LysR family transcriptional regulator [Rhizocola hellebori]
MADHLDFRLLRYYVAVAEELHFTRAAQRLYVAQQALSRDVRKLEEIVGVPLLQRTTRSVALTPAGERMLDRARELIALYEQTLHELRGDQASLFVDVAGRGLLPSRVLTRARQLVSGFDFVARFGGGLADSLPRLANRELDVVFGALGEPAPAGVEHRLVCAEPLALLVPVGHRLAGSAELAPQALRDAQVCWRAGDHVEPEWERLAVDLLASVGAPTDPASAHAQVRGLDELEYHLHSRNAPVLTLASQPPVPRAELIPLTGAPSYPWSMWWRKGFRHPGLEALHTAVDEMSSRPGGWTS